MNTSKVDKEKLQPKKIKSEGVNLFISYLLLIVTTFAIIIFLGCQFGCNKKEKIYSLPVTSTFYTFSGAQSDVVEGFSTSFLAASDTDENARQYMVDNAGWGVSITDTFDISMDLHGQKITGTLHAFSVILERNVNINHIFVNFTGLIFFNTFWQWSENGFSGYCTFYGASLRTNFSNVKTLNLQNANFAMNDNMPVSNQLITGALTFDSCDFANLTTLNLSRAIFASTDMTASMSVLTAYRTFESSVFGKLTTLTLSDVNFATNNMTVGAVSTAFATFASCEFYTLVNLNLSGAVFASTNMTTIGDVRTAESTFFTCTFALLTDLNLSGAIFNVASMTTGGSIDTGSATFSDYIFHNLLHLDFGDYELGSDNSGLLKTIDEGCFEDIWGSIKNWDTNNPLQISGSYDWQTNESDQLNSWFGENCWNFTQS